MIWKKFSQQRPRSFARSSKECFAVGAALTGLEMALAGQEGRALHEERRERGEGEIGHGVCRVQTAPPVGQGLTAAAEGSDEAILDWHAGSESAIGRQGKPQNAGHRGLSGHCCI